MLPNEANNNLATMSPASLGGGLKSLARINPASMVMALP